GDLGPAEELLATPWYGALVASPAGDHLAWIASERGRRSVWLADGPDYAPRLVWQSAGDDGQPLSGLRFRAAGSHLVFLRGTQPDPRAAVEKGPKQEVWAAPTAPQPGREGKIAVRVGEGHAPAPRSDGRSVAYVRSGKIYLTPTDHAAESQL